MVVGENVGEMAGAVGGCDPAPAGSTGVTPTAPAAPHQPPTPNIHNIMGGMEGTAGVRLHNHRKKLKQRFDIVKKLGQGTYGKVQLGINKETGQEVAIKTIKKAKIETEADLIRIRREIQIMSSVQHPNIIHIYEVFENREKMVLVMEYAAGGELYDYLSERKVLAETEARRIFRQIATAVYYCHKHKICHRDLKLENILLDENGNAKIADFGLSNVFDETRLLSTFCGSPLYASPEIVRGTPYHGPEVDCWSLGVLLYTLVYGAMPFDGSNFKRLVKQISQGDYFEPKKPSPASPLIRAILTVNPRRRADIEAICSHWWVNDGYDGSGDGVPSCLEEAEELASRTPVRLDLLLSLVPPPAPGGGPLVVGAEAAVVPADGAMPAVEAAVTGVQEMGNGDVVCQPVPPRSHSVGSFMDLEYHGTPSRMPPFVPPERRPKAGGRPLEKEAAQKRKLEGGGASGVCVPKRIDEEGRMEEEERLASIGVSAVLKEEEEDEVKAEEELDAKEPIVPEGSVPVIANEVESMEVDEMAVDESATNGEVVSSEPVKEDVGETKDNERTVTEPASEKVEEVSQPEVNMAEAVTTKETEGKPKSSPESEKVESEVKLDKGVPKEDKALTEAEEEKKRMAKEKEEKEKLEEEKRIAEEEEKVLKEEEEKKAAKALARKRLSLKIPKKMAAATPAVPEAPVAPSANEGSKVPEGKVSEVKQNLVTVPSKDLVTVPTKDSVSVPTKDATKPVAPKTERRRSQAFERFNSLLAASSPSPDSPSADKPKKVFIPGIKVSDAKRAFEKKATNVTAVIKVNNKPIPPSSSKVIPSPSQTKADTVIKKKNEETPKKEVPVKSAKEASKEPTESLSESPSIPNGNKENEEVSKKDADIETPSVKGAEKTIKEDLKLSIDKAVKEKSPTEDKAAKVRRPKDAEKSPSIVKKSSAKSKESQEPVSNISQTLPVEADQMKSPEKPAMNSMDTTDESPIIEVPPVWSKSATLPRRTSRPDVRGVPTPFGQIQAQFISPPPPPQPKPQEQVLKEQPIPQSSPVIPPQAPPASAPCQYSTAVEYTLKPEIEGFPGQLSFTISQGMPNSVTSSSIEQQPPPEPAPQVRRVARPITRHPTAPATFLRSSSLGPTPRTTGTPLSRGVERIIPIKVERDEESETTNSFSQSTSQTTTEDVPSSATPSARPPLYPQGSRVGPRGESLSRQSTQESDSGDTTTAGSQTPTPGLEPIRKSPREFIIPIAVEGGGYVTPRAGSIEPTGTEERQNSADPWHQFHTRAGRMGRPKKMSTSMRSESGASEDEGNSVSSPPPSFNGNPFDDESMSTASTATATPGVARPFHMHRLRSSRPNRRLLEHSDSFSSAEEEDDDDGFEILTAESLFSTLLARVRSLTQRLNVEDGSGSGTGLSNRSSHLFPSAGRLLSGAGLHHHGNTHQFGSLGPNPASSSLSGGGLFSTPSSFRSPHAQTSSSGLWSNLHNSRAGESLSRRLSDTSRFSDPSRYSRSMSGGGINPGGFSSTSNASSATPWRRNTSIDGGILGDKGIGSPGSWRGTDSRGEDSPGSSGSPLGTFVARGSDSREPEECKRERLSERRLSARSSLASRLNASLAKRIQSQQDQSLSPSSCPPLPPSSSSPSSSFSSSSHQPHCNQASPSASSLPPAGKEAQRNGGHVGPSMNDSYSNKPNTPMSPSEEDLPPRYGRMARQTSWNESDSRPSYYDGLKTDSERRDERMASLDALRKRRDIPVSVRVRSSSLGRDRASILNDANESKRNDETLVTRGTRNILDLRSRSSSMTRNLGLNDTTERSRKDINSMHENLSNLSEQSILDKLLHKRDRCESSSAAKEGRRRLLRRDTDVEYDEILKVDQPQSPRPHSLTLPPNMVPSWNGVEESKDRRGLKEASDSEGSTKKKSRRISRFLRPDFFDTPREESVFAKKKDAEVDMLAESERKQKEQHLMGGFLHSLEKRLDKLRGGEKSKKANHPEAEAVVLNDEAGTIAPGCLTSTKLAAEVRKAKWLGTDENSDGNKKGFSSSRVDRAINSLLQREKGKSKKEVSESGLLKRAVGIDERGCPSKSRSSGELARLSVTGGALLGKPVTPQKNCMPVGGDVEVNGVAIENGVGGKFSSKVNAMLAIFRRNEVERGPFNRTSRLRRTQSVAYDKPIPDDILSAIAAHSDMKNDESICNAKDQTEPKSSETESTTKLASKTEKSKKSSKTIKEKSATKTKASLLKEKKVATVKIDKTSEDAPKESVNEKLPQPAISKKVTDPKKDKTTALSSERKNDTINSKYTKSTKNDIICTVMKPGSNCTSSLVTESNSLPQATQPTNERNAKSKIESKSELNSCPVKLLVNPPNESRQIKELDSIESSRSAATKNIDRTATQDSLDSSWSACSDGLADGGGKMREREMVPRQEGVGLEGRGFADPDVQCSNCLDSPSLNAVNNTGERVSGELDGADNDSEESVGDRIRRKSFYCRFNEVPSRRKSRVGRKSSASSLLYSASDHSRSTLDPKPDYSQPISNRRSSGSGRSSSSISPASAMEGNSLDSSLIQLSYRTHTENKRPELNSSLSRDGFSPPPLSYNRPSAIYRRSSTSPYQDRLPSTDPLLHSTNLTTGLWATSSATSLARSNSSSRATSEVEDEVRVTGSKRGEESGHVSYIPSPISPSSSMSNSYHNGISPSLMDEVSLEQDKKGNRPRKFGVTSLADGITKPSPTHRKYNRYSSYSSSDGFTSSSGVKESGPSLLTSEHSSQHMNPIGLPPLGIPLSSKSRAFRNSTGLE